MPPRKPRRRLWFLRGLADKPDFELPGDQNKLIDEIAAVNPNTIVVLNVSQPVALPWLDKVKAILQMWWPGDEGGSATANILLGKTSPAGRLPFTWGKRLEDYAATDPAHPERSSAGVNGATTFSEGVHVGYRWFDKQKTVPLFPFGYGLSYTTFAYSELKNAPAGDGGLEVTFQLKNTGRVASDEVPQVYLGAPTQRPPGADFAVRALAAFRRVHLDAGQSQSVTIHLPLRSSSVLVQGGGQVGQGHWSARDNGGRLVPRSAAGCHRLHPVITTRNERQTQTDGERERWLHSYVAAEAKVRHLIYIC